MPTDALITQSIPSLINGVSQQPTIQRLTSQAEAQENVVSDVANGAVVRPPSEHIALLTGSFTSVPLGGANVHIINRGDGQRFAAVIQNGDVNVYDLTDGTEQLVNDNASGSEGNYDYLAFDTSSYTAEEAFAAVTVADYTFIVNRTLETAMAAGPTTTRQYAHEFILFIKGSGPSIGGSTVNLRIGGTNYSGVPTAPGNSSDTMDGLTNALTGGVLATGVPAPGSAGPATDFIFTRIGDNVLHGRQALNLGTLRQVQSSDAQGDTIHTLATTGTDGSPPSVSKFSDLPNTGWPDFAVKVKGDDGTDEDEFWVKYSDENAVWEETVAPGLNDEFDADTMPHALIYNELTGQFSFEPISWATRLAGDANSAPQPSFVGNTIKDILVHKNRLVLISQENAVAGESGQFFNLWPNSVATLIDSDPFDIAGTGNTVAIWDYAVPYRGNLTLFSPTGNTIGEVVGSRDEPLTIKNARIEERVNYAVDAIRPVAAGEQVYFLADHSGHSVLYAYTEADLELFRADEVTAHVQNYVPSNIVRMSAGRAENFITLLSGDVDEDHRLYMYRYHFLGNEQAMSSWSRWSFQDDDMILAADWVESTLYLFISRQDGIHLEKVDFGKDDEDADYTTASNLGYRVHLDSLMYLTGSYDVGTNRTTWTIPFDQATNGGTYRIVKGGAWGTERGSLIPVADASVDGSISAVGDLTAFPVYIGREFTWTYELSEIHLRDQRGSGSSGRGRVSGRLQLREGRVTFKDTGTFNVELRSREDSDVYTDTYTSQFLNQAIFGPTGLAEGTFDFNIGGDSRDVRIIFTGTSFLPAQLTAFEWTGRYIQRSDQA